MVTESNGSQPDRRATDDGEPHGTAGRPLLAVLDGAELINALAVVIRYFGGQKLGTGGLVRAYGASARGALEAACIEPVIPRTTLLIHVPFSLESAIRHEIDLFAASIENAEYASEVTVTVTLPTEERGDFEVRLADATGGSAKIDNKSASE
jgi:putative IMPACT (imprinted ancient) family translation regulator